MKTKQEVIKEAWVRCYCMGVGLDSNGWLNERYLTNAQCVELNKDESFEYSTELGYRPKSLQGIENNNGWVSIKSEEDLPKGYIECYFITKYSYNTILSGYFSFSDKTFYNNQNCYNINEITHYRPIVKPKNPLY